MPELRPSRPPIPDIQDAGTITPETGREQGDRQSCQNPAGLFRPILLRHGIGGDGSVGHLRQRRNRDVDGSGLLLPSPEDRIGGQFVQDRVGHQRQAGWESGQKTSGLFARADSRAYDRWLRGALGAEARLTLEKGNAGLLPQGKKSWPRSHQHYIII